MDSGSSTTSFTPKRSYSIQYLMTFAGLEICQRPPPNVDLREVNAELSVEVPEWRRRSTPLSSSASPERPHRRIRNKKCSSSSRLQELEKGRPQPHEAHEQMFGAISGVATFPVRRRILGFNPDKNYIKLDPGIDRPEYKTLEKTRKTLTPLKLRDDDTSVTSSADSVADTPTDKDVNDEYRAKSNKFAGSNEFCSESLSDQVNSTDRVHHRLMHVLSTPGSEHNSHLTTDSGEGSPFSNASSSDQKLDLGALFGLERHRVLPMPLAPTLQDIEKDIILSEGSKPAADDKCATEVFLTCQDVEQSILADTEVSPTTVDSHNPTRQWLDVGDRAASEHILSVLQKRPSNGCPAENVSSKELFGELISRTPISTGLSNLDDVLKRYEEIAAADFEQAVSQSKQDEQDGSFDNNNSRFVCSATVDSLRTSVKQSEDDGRDMNAVNRSELSSPGASSEEGKKPKKLFKPRRSALQKGAEVPEAMRSPRGVLPQFNPTFWQTVPPLHNHHQHHHHWQQQQQQQQQQQVGVLRPTLPYSPNSFILPARPGIETPLVPQALQALQRLVDHQLHILNNIPGEVTPGMLHQRLSRSVLGYPATGTHLLVATSSVGIPTPAAVVPFSRYS